METKLIRIWSEWDINHERLVFSSEDDARLWLGRNPHVDEIVSMEEGTLEDVIADGLIGFEEVTLVS